jgi:hypothetical protein
MSSRGKTEGEAILRPSRRMDCFRIVSRERAQQKKIHARTSARSSAALRIERDQIVGATRQPRCALNCGIGHYFSVFELIIGARADS